MKLLTRNSIVAANAGIYRAWGIAAVVLLVISGHQRPATAQTSLQSVASQYYAATSEPSYAGVTETSSPAASSARGESSFLSDDERLRFSTVAGHSSLVAGDESEMPHIGPTMSEAMFKQDSLGEETEVTNQLPLGTNIPPSLISTPGLADQSGSSVVRDDDCGCSGPGCSTWSDSRHIPWSMFGPGEYVGPPRTEHVSTYFLRVNDLLTLTFITSRRKEAERYRIGCGDQLRLEWWHGPAEQDTFPDRDILVQPDGTISLPLVGDVMAAGKTVKELREELEDLFGKYQRDPQITVMPLEVNTALQDILDAVTSKYDNTGQAQDLRVTPEGTIQAPGLGSVYVQGLTLEELRSELEARYAATFGPGLLISPSLTQRATNFVFVGGEVRSPGRYTLEGPTTVMQAITLAGGWNVGGNLHQVVVFRRDENWCLKAIKIDIRKPLYGHDPCPNDIWLRDLDLVIVPKERILCAADVISLYFTRGVYAVFPINYVYDFSSRSGIVPVP